MAKRAHYVLRCPKCGSVQSFHTGKDLTDVTFRCRDNECGRTTKLHDKRSGGLRADVKGPMAGLKASSTALVHKRRDHPNIDAALEQIEDKLEGMPPHRREDLDPPGLADMCCPTDKTEFKDASSLAGPQAPSVDG